jgi:hypothetical protein
MFLALVIYLIVIMIRKNSIRFNFNLTAHRYRSQNKFREKIINQLLFHGGQNERLGEDAKEYDKIENEQAKKSIFVPQDTTREVYSDFYNRAKTKDLYGSYYASQDSQSHDNKLNKSNVKAVDYAKYINKRSSKKSKSHRRKKGDPLAQYYEDK